MAVQETYASPAEAIPEEQATDFAHELISSRRVEGTAVYSEAGEKLGTIHSVMIGKTSGQVAYAVLSAGGRVMALDEEGRETGPLTYGKIAERFLNPPFIAWGN